MNFLTTINKYLEKTIVLLIFVLLHSYTYSQCVIKSAQHIIYKSTNTNIQYIEYIIDNHSQDTIYLWIDQETNYNDSLTFEQNNIVFFFKYVRHPKCELGLYFLCYDGNINYGNHFPPPPVIGCTFLKKLNPGESFQVISLDDKIDENSIHYVPRNVVSKLLKLDMLDRLCYPELFIII